MGHSESSPTRLVTNASGRWTVVDAGDGVKVFSRPVPYSGTVVLEGTKERLRGVADLADFDEALAVLRAGGVG